MPFSWPKFSKKRNGEGLSDSQVAKFVNKMGMELDKEIVQVGNTNSRTDSDQNGLEIRKGIKVNAIRFGTFFHGFGIRKNDVIVSFNDIQITSASSVNIMLHRIISSHFHSLLTAVIIRPGGEESGTEELVELHNHGIDLGNTLVKPNCNDTSTKKGMKIQSVGSELAGKYLVVTQSTPPGLITLSNMNTPPNDKYFIIQQYVPFLSVSNLEEKFITLQHRTSGNYIWVNNQEVSLMPANSSNAPSGCLISRTSNYLFKVVEPTTVPPPPNRTVTFQPINNNGQEAIGFENTQALCTLLPNKDIRTFFRIV